MSYAETILSQITELRQAQAAHLNAGDLQQAEYLQRAIQELFSSYEAFTGDID